MSKKGRVFVVQNQHRLNAAKQQFEPKFDLSPAAEYGELVYLLSPTASPFRPEPLVAELREKLRGFDDDDHLLLIGNPVLIGLAVTIASDWNDGSVSLLQWSGKDGRYLRVAIKDLFTY